MPVLGRFGMALLAKSDLRLSEKGVIGESGTVPPRACWSLKELTLDFLVPEENIVTEREVKN